MLLYDNFLKAHMMVVQIRMVLEKNGVPRHWMKMVTMLLEWATGNIAQLLQLQQPAGPRPQQQQRRQLIDIPQPPPLQ